MSAWWDLAAALADTDGMDSHWPVDVGIALTRLMEHSGRPTQAELTTAFDAARVVAPQWNRAGENQNKVKRLRAALQDARATGIDAVIALVAAVTDEMRHAGVFDDRQDERQDHINALRKTLSREGIQIDAEGRVERGYLGPEVDAGGRETVERLQRILREPALDPGAILGTSKDLLEAAAKHLLHECDPSARPSDMPAIVGQAMRAAGLSTRSDEIDSRNAKAIAALRQQVTKTAEAVTPLRNKGGDGHGHLEPTDVNPELSDFIRHMSLAAVAYLMKAVDG